MANSKDALKIVERELIKFASYDNASHVLSKYMIGKDARDRELIEKILVIFATEFRHQLEKISGNLPSDEAEAEAIVAKKAAGRRGRPRKTVSGPIKMKVVDIKMEDEL